MLQKYEKKLANEVSFHAIMTYISWHKYFKTSDEIMKYITQTVSHI